MYVRTVCDGLIAHLIIIGSTWVDSSKFLFIIQIKWYSGIGDVEQYFAETNQLNYFNETIIHEMFSLNWGGYETYITPL